MVNVLGLHKELYGNIKKNMQALRLKKLQGRSTLIRLFVLHSADTSPLSIGSWLCVSSICVMDHHSDSFCILDTQIPFTMPVSHMQLPHGLFLYDMPHAPSYSVFRCRLNMSMIYHHGCITDIAT